MIVKINFSAPFRGVAYSDYDRSSPCKFYGDGSKYFEMRLPLKGCGTKQVCSCSCFRKSLSLSLESKHVSLLLSARRTLALMLRNCMSEFVLRFCLLKNDFHTNRFILFIPVERETRTLVIMMMKMKVMMAASRDKICISSVWREIMLTVRAKRKRNKSIEELNHISDTCYPLFFKKSFSFHDHDDAWLRSSMRGKVVHVVTSKFSCLPSIDF